MPSNSAGRQSRRDLKPWATIVFVAALLAGSPLRAVAEPSDRPAEDNLARRVVLLANSEDPNSLRVARHYAAARGVPVGNLIAIPMPTNETITWREFIPEIWEPLIARLVRDRWLDAIPMDLTDSLGRRKYAVSGHRIAALVVCRGVPLKIAHDQALYTEVPRLTIHPEYRTNAGAVDAELSMLARPDYPITAFVPNPLFQNEHPRDFEEGEVVKVSRLDGPTPEDALALVDRAIEAERNGLLGRAYVDFSERDPIGNRWLEATLTQLNRLGFDTSVDRAPATIPDGARFDAPVLYFGWYAENIEGPFTLPGFRFPPGAIALHIHSYSAGTVRSTTRGWVGPFVARGVTATMGNVFEPYLHMTQRPDLLVRALARGANLVDATYFAIQGLSWQEVLIGDPLYRPFVVPVENQLKILERNSPRAADYAILRHVYLLDADGRHAEARDSLRKALHHRPSLVLGFALAQRLSAAGDRSGAVAALTAVPLLPAFGPDEWGLARDAAALLATCEQPAGAVEIFRVLLEEKDLPRNLKLLWLGDAIADARAANNADEAATWQAEREALSTDDKG